MKRSVAFLLTADDILGLNCHETMAYLCRLPTARNKVFFGFEQSLQISP